MTEAAHPADVSELLQRAGLLVDVGHLDEARELLSAALAEDPYDVRLLTALADVAARAGDVEAAHRAATAAIAADPGAEAARYVLGAVYLAAGMVDDAVAVARDLVAESPNDAEAHALLASGLSHDALLGHKRRDALTAIDRALELSPNDPDLAVRLARSAERMHEPSRAREIALAGLRVDPTHPDLRMIVARTAAFTGDRAQLLTGVLADEPTHRLARHQLAEVVWGTLARLASGVWVYALAVMLLSVWVQPSSLQHVTPLLLAPLIAHWIRLFVRLRKRLPKGYLAKRLWRSPIAVLGLLLAGLAAVVALLSPVAIVAGWDSEGVRVGYQGLIAACVIAGVAHVLVTIGGIPRGGDVDPRTHLADRDGMWLVWLLGLGVPIGLCWALAHFATQPGALWFALMLPPMVLAVRAVEWALIKVLRLPGARASKVLKALVAAVFVAGCGWAVLLCGHETAVADFVYTEGPLSPGNLQVPTFTPLPPLDVPTPH